MKKLFFRFDFSPKIKKFLTTLHNTQEQAILWIIRQLLPFLFPRHCPLCGKLLPYGSFIHEECHRELPLIHSPVCMRCGKPVSSHTQEYCYDCRAFPKSFQRGLSLFLYNKKTRPIMSAFKYQNRRGLADFFCQELCVLDKVLPIHTVMFPCPGPDTKGIALIPTVSGNFLIGSTATMREDKYDVTNDAHGIDELIKGAKMLLPDFDPRCIIRTFAGQRPVVLNNGNDFYIRESETVKGFIHAAGIQSPGIASSPAIAEYVRDLLANAGLDLKDKSDYNPYREPIPDFSDLSLEEQDALIKKDPAWGKIVCRCETVPEGEIIAAIHSTLGARTVEGVKRRTRAGMGRCQSGFCQYKVMQILSRELGIPEEQVLFEEQGAQVLYGKIKG